jgi:hypothetical protein
LLILHKDDEIQLESNLTFSGSSENSVYSDQFSEIMTLLSDYRVVVNSSAELPANSWFKCYAKLEFLNGDELVISSDKLYGGSYGYWNVSLNPYWFSAIDYTFRYPISFNTTIFDPSVDDVTYDLEYSVNMVLEINCTDTLPVSDSFVIEQPLGNTSYSLNAYQSGSDKYVNITATQQFDSETFDNNSFPATINFY